MKVKLEYTTNSSSSSYILEVSPSIYNDVIKHIKRYPYEVYLDHEFDNLQDLQDFTNGRPYDWASAPRGLNYIKLTQYQYEQIKKIIECGQIALILRCDHYMEESFYKTNTFKKLVMEFFDDDSKGGDFEQN